MMINFWRICLVVLWAGGFSGYAGEPRTVLAFGDSITAGGSTYTCYRQILVPALREKGAAFAFIGPKKDATSAHAGYGGKNTAYLRKISQAVYQEYPADIVLLHSGHNSFSKDKPVAGIVRDTEAIIRTVAEIDPKVTVLLAQVIPAGKLPKYSYIPDLNRELATLAGRLSKSGYAVVLVDHATGFDWRTDTVSDKVHPNAAGATKMANAWMAALLTLSRKKDAE